MVFGIPSRTYDLQYSVVPQKYTMEPTKKLKLVGMIIMVLALTLMYQIMSSSKELAADNVVSQEQPSDPQISTKSDRSEEQKTNIGENSGTQNNGEDAQTPVRSKVQTPVMIPDYDPTKCPALDESSVISRLKDFCGGVRHYQNNWIELVEKYDIPSNHIVYDEKKKYVWYTVPKIASSNWKRLILKDKFSNVWDKDKLQDAIKSPHESMEECCTLTPERAKAYPDLGKAFTFTFMRNPWSRLYSAFRDKVVYYKGLHDHKYIKMILYIVRGLQFGTINDETLKKEEKSISFTDFLTYLAKTDTSSYNVHWTPWFILTNACQIRFDYIGHIENMDKDFLKLQDAVFKNPDLQLWPAYNNTSTRRDVIEAYSRVPSGILDEVYKRYKDDFIIGGYSRNVSCIK